MKYHLCNMVFLICALNGVHATEYFVSPRGGDMNDGLSRATAFATIQKGVDALAPGDVLTIAPGEYPEAVARRNLGSMEADTVIRAEIPGTVLVRGDVAVEGFRKVEGHRFIYVTAFDRQPYAMAEVDTLRLMNEAIYLDELEFLPGTYFYDAESGNLYISSSDTQPPGAHVYRAAMIPDHGINFEQPTRVVLDGLAATGFNFNEVISSTEAKRGIQLKTASHCKVLRCVTYLNGGGIALVGPLERLRANFPNLGHNVVRDCISFANYSRFNQEGGNITAYRAGPNARLKGNTVYLSKTHGQRFYLAGEGPLRMEEGIGWGNRGNFWIKVGGTKPATAHRMVDLGKIPAPEFSHSIVGETTIPDPTEKYPDSIFLDQEQDLDRDAEFADPVHFDYRLQGGSRFIGAAPGGADLGPFPYRPNIFYLKTDGDDRADGRSLAAAWKTFARAFQTLKPGNTLYVAGGTYEEAVTGAPRGLSIRRRGQTPVVLAGEWRLKDAADMDWMRLTFTGAVAFNGGHNVRLNNCLFVEEGQLVATGVDALRIEHGLFAQTVGLNACSDLHLSGNIFAATPGVHLSDGSSVRTSDYNSYPTNRGTPVAWQQGDSPVSLADIQPHHDLHSITATPALRIVDGAVRIDNQTAFNGRGPLGSAIGPYFAGAPRRLDITGPFLHSVSDATADIEWWTTYPAIVEFAWGPTPACEHRRTFHFHNYGGYSLTALKPGETYYYRIKILEPMPRLEFRDWIQFDPGKTLSGQFTTLEQPPAPTTYHVAVDGDDARDGLARETAWRTLNHAAAHVGPGDTVLVGGGTYAETVWLRASGAAGRPITFRAAPGERVVIDGGKRRLFAAFVGNGKHHQRLDGFYGINFGRIAGHDGAILPVDTGGMFIFSYCDNVTVQRCLQDGRGPGYSPYFMFADGCANLRVKNCVGINAFGGPKFINCPGLRIEHSVLFRNLISQLMVVSHSDQPALVANNIFTDGLAKKFQAATINLGRPAALTERNNCYYTRGLSREKTIVCVYGDFEFDRARRGRMMGPRRETYPVFPDLTNFTLHELERVFGPTDSIIADPEFAGLADVPSAGNSGQPIYPPDRLPAGPVDFSDFFATNPEVVKRGIGLQPEAFETLGNTP